MKPQLVFGRINYILMLAGIAVILLGFTLMAGHDDIYSDVKLSVSPIVLMVGFLIEIVAILYKPKANLDGQVVDGTTLDA